MRLETSRYNVRSHSGFTLIEMVIALVIFFIAVLGVFAAITYATRYNRGNSQRSQALAVLQREVEFLRSAKFTPSVVSDGTGMLHQDSSAQTCPDIDNTPTATPIPDDGSRDLRGGTRHDEFRCGIDGTVYRVRVWVDDNPTTPTGTPDAYPWPTPVPAASPAPTPPIALMKQITVEVTPQGADRWVDQTPIRMTFRRVRGN